MEYGKSFGVGVGGGVVLLGMRVGYGWLISGALVFTIAAIVAIRFFFRRNKPLGYK